MIRNRGKDSTLEPAYLAEIRYPEDSGDYEARIKRLEILVKEIQDIVDGTAAEGYEDGLVYRVSELERIVSELVIEDKVKYDTTANWNSQPQLIAEKGCIYIYSDAKNYQGVELPRFKVGTGSVYLIDLMFIDSDIVDYLQDIVVVTEEEKEKWNNKVSCSMDEGNENLVFVTG